MIPNPAGTPTTERHGFYHCANTLGTYEVRAIGVSGGIEQVAEPITVTVVNRPAQEFFVDYFDHFDEDRDNREHWTRGTLRIEHPPMGISVCNNDLAISLYLKAAPGALADSTGFSADYTMEFDVKQARETMFHKVDARSFMPILMNEGGNPTETYVWFTHPLRTFEGRLNVPSTPEQLLWKIGLSVQAESDASASAYRNLNIAISSDQAYDIDADGDPQSEDPNAPNYYPKRDH